jgi:hypothetical protein
MKDWLIAFAISALTLLGTLALLEGGSVSVDLSKGIQIESQKQNLDNPMRSLLGNRPKWPRTRS